MVILIIQDHGKAGKCQDFSKGLWWKPLGSGFSIRICEIEDHLISWKIRSRQTGHFRYAGQANAYHGIMKAEKPISAFPALLMKESTNKAKWWQVSRIVLSSLKGFVIQTFGRLRLHRVEQQFVQFRTKKKLYVPEFSVNLMPYRPCQALGGKGRSIFGLITWGNS